MRALQELRPLRPAFVSVTYGAGGSTREKTLEIVSRLKSDFGLEAMAHFTCVDATREELRATLDEMRDAGRQERAGAARRPAAGRGAVDEDRGRPRVLARADRADRRRATTSRSAGPASPRCTSTPSTPRATCATSRRRSTRARASSSRSSSSTTPLLRLRRAGARHRASTCRSCPASCRSRTSGRSSGSRRCAASDDPRRAARALEARADEPEAVAEFGVAYATLQCAELLAQRRARDPLLHAQPLARDAGDPQRAQAACARGRPAAPSR